MYVFSEATARDIENLLEQSIHQFGLQQTQDYHDSLKKCLELLVQNPCMGMQADDLKPGYRCFLHESHVLFYRVVEDDTIFIIRVLHKHMDIHHIVDD